MLPLSTMASRSPRYFQASTTSVRLAQPSSTGVLYAQNIVKQAFHMRRNEFVHWLNIKKQDKYLSKAEIYNAVVQVLEGFEKNINLD